jgi:predicted HTH domain antitoxin
MDGFAVSLYFVYNKDMEIEISDELLRGAELSREDALRDLAIGLYVDEKVTLEQAAQIASLTQPEFLKVLGKHRVPVHYDIEDLQADVKVVREL